MKIGKVSESVLKRSVLKQIKTKRSEVLKGAGVGSDCALFAFSDGEYMVSCVQEGAGLLTETYQGGFTTISHLIQKCANNLAAGRSEPLAVTIALLLPESTEEPQIKAIMSEAEKKCRELRMQIVGGQTRVTTGVSVPVAVVTGYGKLPGPGGEKGQVGAERVSPGQMPGGKPAPGQDILISKWIGLEGTAMLAKKFRESLLERYPVYFIEEAASFDRFYSIIPEAATAVKSGVCAMHDASEGGIFTALWELAESAGVGLTVDLKKLPLRQETVEVCEHCNVNPYELMSGGCLVMTSTDGEALAAALHARGIPAVAVGKITDSRDRILLNEDEVRYMERPRTDEIYKAANAAE